MAEYAGWKKFLWQWLVACVVAKLLQIFLDGVARWFGSVAGIIGLTEGITTFLLILILFRLLSGALGGAAQWLVLRQWLPSIRSWVLATSLGNPIALALLNWLLAVKLMAPASDLMQIMMPALSVLPQFVFGGIYGMLLGLAQWFVLRTKVPQAGWWVPINAAGMMLSGIVISGLQRLIGPTGIDVSQSASNPFFWAIAALGVVPYAVMTGGFLVCIINSRNKTVSS